MRNLMTSSLIFIALLFSGSIFAHGTIDAHGTKDSKVKVVIHLSASTNNSYQAAINYTKAIRKLYKGNVDIAIVTDRSGVGLINSKNQYTQQVNSLIADGVKFTACNATITRLRKIKELPIIEGVNIVPNGVAEVVRLQTRGYLYVQP